MLYLAHMLLCLNFQNVEKLHLLLPYSLKTTELTSFPQQESVQQLRQGLLPSHAVP
jgi:hypothetical protein